MLDIIEGLRRPVLVLGASGFIGSRVVGALDGSSLYRAVAASRHSTVSVEATNKDSVQALLQGVDCVINCVAGNTSTMVRSTQALCDAARACPPRRIVHLSSMAVYGNASGTVREDQVAVAPVSGYGQAKLECERIIRKFVEDGGDAVILRPTCVFGPGSPQWTTRLARLLKAGRIGDLGMAGDGRCNLAFIDDVVAGIIAALGAEDVSGKAFNISSSSDLTWNGFLVAFGQALGATPVRRISMRRLKIETKLLAPIRRVAAMAPRFPTTEAITSSLVALWRQDIRIDCMAAQVALSLPRTTPQQMIAAVLSDRHAASLAAFS